MESLIKRFQIKSIRTRLTVYYSLTIIGISLLMIMTVSHILVTQFQDRKNNLILEQMQVINWDIEKELSFYVENAFQLKREAVVRDYLTQGAEKEEAENLLQGGRYIRNGLRSLMLINPEQEMISSFSMAESVQNTQVVQECIGSGKEIWFSLPHNYPFSSNSDDYMDNNIITCSVTIRNEKTYEKEGYLLSNITRDYLFGGQKAYIEQTFDQLYVVSAGGGFIYRSGEQNEQMEENIRDLISRNNQRALWISDDEYSYFIRTIDYFPNWKLVGAASNKNLMEDIRRVQLFIAGLCILGIGLVVMISRRISKIVAVPVYRLNEAMQVFEQGEIPSKVTVEAHDELDHLVNRFNVMIDDMKGYIRALEKYERETAQAEIMALKFQLESLQSQINPHFLYNTLNTVVYLAVKGRTEQIRNLIQELNLLLRSTLSDTEAFICIEREIRFLEAYVHIQEYRYPDRITLRIECDEALKSMLIPKLILQPLVENALLHGIFPSGKSGEVMVRIESRDDNICIAVKDDGTGMEDPDFLLNSDGRKKGFNRIGLYNVNERLLMYYGPEAGLKIDSLEGKGTSVAFVIRKETERM